LQSKFAKNGESKYLVKWESYGDEFNSWETASVLSRISPGKVRDYISTTKTAPTSISDLLSQRKSKLEASHRESMIKMRFTRNLGLTVFTRIVKGNEIRNRLDENKEQRFKSISWELKEGESLFEYSLRIRKYVDEISFWENVKINIEKIDLIGQDTYDETFILDSINKIGIQKCFGVALQLGIVGFGKKNYGKVKINELEIDIKTFFQENKISFNSRLNDVLEPGQLTPRRLIRFFRFGIKRYIEKQNVPSYLFKKYCPQKDHKFQNLIFPGVEHYLDPRVHDVEIARLLITTYKNLDKQNESTISDRIFRALLARGFQNHDLE